MAELTRQQVEDIREDLDVNHAEEEYMPAGVVTEVADTALAAMDTAVEMARMVAGLCDEPWCLPRGADPRTCVDCRKAQTVIDRWGSD